MDLDPREKEVDESTSRCNGSFTTSASTRGDDQHHVQAAVGDMLMVPTSAKENNEPFRQTLPFETLSTVQQEQLGGADLVDEDQDDDVDHSDLSIESKADVEWLLAQLRIGNHDSADVDELLSTLSSNDHQALWKLYAESLRTAVKANRPMVDLNGREILPPGFYEWKLVGGEQISHENDATKKYSYDGAHHSPRPAV